MSSRPGGHDGREGWAATAPPSGAAHCRPGSRWARRNWVRYPARAPSASAICRHASRCGVERGRCRTTRRTERTTWTPSFSSRSRSHVTWLRAHAVRAARNRSSCMSYVGRGLVRKTRNWFDRERTAARAVDLQPIEQFLDPILDVPASTVDLLIDEARRLPQISSPRTANVVPRLAVSEANDFGLDHDPALVGPTCGLRSGCRYRRARSRHRPRSARGPPAWRTPHAVRRHRVLRTSPRRSRAGAPHPANVEDLTGSPKPPSSRTRNRARGNAARNSGSNRSHSRPRVPSAATAFPAAAASPRTDTAPPRGRSSETVSCIGR